SARSSIRRRRPFPIGVGSNSSSLKTADASLRGGPRTGAPITAHKSRSTAPQSAARPTGSAGVSAYTGPTVRRASFCWLCTLALAPAPLMNACKRRRPHDRWYRHDKRAFARLYRTAGAHRATHPAGTVVVIALDPAAPAPAGFSPDQASPRNPAEGGDAGPPAL